MLKKLALSTALLALCATPASAIDVALSGTVATTCTVTSNNATYNFANLSTQTATVATLTYTCNSPNGFSRSISSPNGGVLRNGSYDGPSYQVSSSGSFGLTRALVTPTVGGVTDSVAADDAFLSGATGDLSVSLTAPAGLLYAGNYTDTLTLTIAAQ